MHVEAELAHRLTAVAARPRVATLGGIDSHGDEGFELRQPGGFGSSEHTVGDGTGNRHLFGMLGLSVAAVLDVAAGIGATVEGEDRGSDVVVGVRAESWV